jgi:single-strand DNA-binding protein
LTGRSSKDTELRYLATGKAVANGTIAVQRKYKNAQGEYEADFHDFVAWGKTGELMAQYIRKGDSFGLSGELVTRIWEKNDGTKQKITEINVASFDFPNKPKQQQTPQSDDPFADGTPVDYNDSNLPF